MRKPGTECEYEGCFEEVHAKGLCPGHHAQMYRVGVLSELRKRTTPEERFWRDVTQGDYCWEWTGPVEKGAGRFWGEGKPVLAHVYSYTLHKGPIPNGQEVDHKCRNRRCVNPDHLRAVERWKNAQNKEARKNNTSGYKGVTFIPKLGKYLARGRGTSGERVAVGYFTDPEEAAKNLIMHNLEQGIYTLYDQRLSRRFGIEYPDIADWT